MREPYFWRDLDPRSRASAPVTRLLLTPLAAIYGWAGQRRIEKTVPYEAGVPVICVGNLTLGGAGKTPVTEALRGYIGDVCGVRCASLSRGYGGSLEGPLKVVPGAHSTSEVGDEPLMLSQSGESWISKDRIAGVKAMEADGVGAVIMDDGHQNPTVSKKVSVVVIDASEPFGSGHVFPKGPLREPVERGLGRADLIVMMGDGAVPDAVVASGLPVLRGRLVADRVIEAGAYIAFAGIGRPERFFDSLQKLEGVVLSEAVPFADHHAYSSSDLKYLTTLAAERDARLVTTSKDAMRLPAEMRDTVVQASVKVAFDESDALKQIVELADMGIAAS